MGVHLECGQRVRVNAYGGKRPYVMVVKDLGEVVLICKPSEFESAKIERREPIAVGFHKEDVILQEEDEAA